MKTMNFAKAGKEIKEFDKKREKLIKKSHGFISLTKQVIYALHRDDMKRASSLLNDLKKDFSAIARSIKDCPALYYSGIYRTMVQEYIEAVSYHDFVKTARLAECTEKAVMGEHYLLGICDLTGELVRKAVSSAIRGDYDSPVRIRDFVADIYGRLLNIDFRGGELRKKSDEVRYNLKKLEDLVLDIKLKR